MRAVEVLLILLVVAVAVVVALGWGDRMVSVPVDRAPTGLDPDAPVSAADIADLRFNLAARGYRMAEVDRVLGQLAELLAAKDGRIAELESDPAGAGTLGGVNTATIPAPGPGTATLPAPGPDPLPPSPPAPPGPGPGPDPSPPGRPTPGPGPDPAPPGPGPGPDPAPPGPGPGPDPAPPPQPLEPPGTANPPMLSEREPAAADTESAPVR